MVPAFRVSSPLDSCQLDPSIVLEANTSVELGLTVISHKNMYRQQPAGFLKTRDVWRAGHDDRGEELPVQMFKQCMPLVLTRGCLFWQIKMVAQKLSDQLERAACPEFAQRT